MSFDELLGSFISGLIFHDTQYVYAYMSISKTFFYLSVDDLLQYLYMYPAYQLHYAALFI